MRIFVCPLDWGLGHAARCIPIIRHLLSREIDVVIGAEGKHLAFLKEQFPHIESVEFPGYRISYSKSLPVGVMVFLQVPQMFKITANEHELLDKLIEEKKIDAVISDNRYGLWNEKIPCVIMTHQLNIQGKLLNTPASKVTHSYINRFDECWIPDYEGKENLSGLLAHPIPKGINGKYLGPLSRFESAGDYHQTKNKYDLLVLLSGPEPQRSKLEEIILKELNKMPSIKALIMQGLPGSTHPLAPSITSREGGHIDIVPHLPDAEFQDAVTNSDVILCRAGYSTLMDLHAIGWKKAIFVPTPGQTEQVYLGNLMQEQGMGVTYTQKEIILKDALESAQKLHPVPPDYGKGNYKEVIDTWIKKIL